MCTHRRSAFARRLIACLTLALVSACGGGGSGGGGGGGSGPSGAADLTVTAFSAPSNGIAGDTYTVTGTITNQGGLPAAGISAIIYLSPFSDVTVDGGLAGLGVTFNILDPGESWSFSLEADLSDNVANGDYYLGVHAPYSDDANPANNTRSQAITISGGTDCTPDSHEPNDSAAAATPILFGEAQRHNHCDSTSDWLRFAATAGETYGLMTSQLGDEAWTRLLLYDTDGQTLLDTGGNSAIEFGASRLQWTAPVTGNYYARVAPMMGTGSGGANTDYTVTLGGTQPDLLVNSFSASSTGFPGGDITVYDTVINQGFTAAGSFPVGIYLSDHPDVTTADRLIGSRNVTSLDVNASDYSAARVYQLPADVGSGDRYIAAIANPNGAVGESVTSNNTSAVQTITVQAPAVACAANENDAYEEDDIPADAQPITVGGGASQSRNHCDDVADWVSFSAVAGQDYAIRVNRDGGVSSAWIELYDQTASTPLEGGSGVTAIDWQAPANGQYLMRVGANSFGGDRPYTLKVDPGLPDLTATIYLAASSTARAGGYLRISDEATNIGHRPAGPFTIGVYASPDSNVTTADKLVATRSVSGLPDASTGISSNRLMHDAHFPRDLPLGTYYLAAIADLDVTVAELSETNNTSAPITIDVVAPECDWDAYEDDESPAMAKPILLDETQARNLCDDAVDWVSFTPSVGGMYVAAGEHSISIFQSDGSTEVEPHASEVSEDIVSWSATAGETYYLKNAFVAASIGGAYNFTVFQCTPDAFEDDDTAAEAKAIAVGEVQSRDLCEDPEDWVRFDATAGATYTIETTNANGGTYNADLTLYDTDGRTLLTRGTTAQGSKKYVIDDWTAPANGTYYIQARPRLGMGAFGKDKAYTLSLN